jgi:hypothetical protein
LRRGQDDTKIPSNRKEVESDDGTAERISPDAGLRREKRELLALPDFINPSLRHLSPFRTACNPYPYLSPVPIDSLPKKELLAHASPSPPANGKNTSRLSNQAPKRPHCDQHAMVLFPFHHFAIHLRDCHYSDDVVGSRLIASIYNVSLLFVL